MAKKQLNFSESIHMRIRESHYDYFAKEAAKMNISIPQMIRFFFDETLTENKEFKIEYSRKKAKGSTVIRRERSGASATL